MSHEMSNTELAYFAGLIDGEGCISISYKDGRKTKRNPSGSWIPYVTVNMCSEGMIYQLHAAFGGKLVFKRYKKELNWKPQWMWQVTYRCCVDTCVLLIPYLRIKKRQAEIILELQATRSNPRIKGFISASTIERRMKLLNEIKRLNKRGTAEFVEVVNTPHKNVRAIPATCRNGHPISESKLYPDGRRKCRICRRKNQNNYRASKRNSPACKLGAPRGEFVTIREENHIALRG